MKSEHQIKWDEEMQERIFGASPMDDYDFKTRTFPKYSTDPAAARKLVGAVNASGRYRIHVNAPDQAEPDWSVEVRDAGNAEILGVAKGADEAYAIVQAIVTADVTLR